jgi:hypothetical protein
MKLGGSQKSKKLDQNFESKRKEDGTEKAEKPLNQKNNLHL